MLDVQTLVPHASVKGFNEGIFHGFSRSNEIELYAPSIRPIFERSRLKFGPVIHRDGPWAWHSRSGLDRGPGPPSHPTSANRLLAWDFADSSYPRPSRLETAAHRPGYHAQNPCSSAPWVPLGWGMALGGGRYVFAAGPAYAAAIRRDDRAVVPVCDSPAILPDTGAPRSADTQTAAWHGRDPESAGVRPIDPAPDCGDTWRPD